MAKYVFILFILIFFSVSVMIPAAPQAEETKEEPEGIVPFKIYMILWRGLSQAEVGFMDYLLKQGYACNFMIRDCDKDKSNLEDILREIEQEKPDLIYTCGTTISTALLDASRKGKPGNVTGSIPMVFNIVTNPDAAGLSAKGKATRFNVTGVSHSAPALAQVERIKALLKPGKVGVIYDPREENSRVRVKILDNLSSEYGFKLIEAPLKFESGKLDIKNLPGQLAHLFEAKPDVVYLPSDASVILHGKHLLELVNKHRIPTYSDTEEPIRESGALMGLVCRYYEMGEIAGKKAEQILVEKKRPLEVPIYKLSKYIFLFNKKTAGLIGFPLTEEVLKIADEVIEK
ncbi:MAG: hypothetical protein GY950_36870 [bacterium]|nr:hypothetical protein [bacterium]